MESKVSHETATSANNGNLSAASDKDALAGPHLTAPIQSTGPLYHPGYAPDDDPKRLYPASGGFMAPQMFTRPRELANPAPLGLMGFALTTFILSMINVFTRSLEIPNIVVGPAYAYGGLCQLIAGIFEMCQGKDSTFGATALASYGGFWISLAIILTPGFGVATAYPTTDTSFDSAFGIYLLGWFIFTFLMFLCTVRSTVAFSSLFGFLTITFLLLSIARFVIIDGAPSVPITKAGGVFGLITAFLAFWCALAGIATKENSFFTIPVGHFPWGQTYKERQRIKRQEEAANTV